jgi:hypothetical protein
VVLNLARDLYRDRSTAPWEGSIPLAEQEAGSRRCLGRVVNLTHPDRPEWATMRAQVQRESLDLTRGTTVLEVGPPAHLSPQNRAALWQVARMARAERTQAARLAPPPASSENDEALDRAGSGGVFPGTVAPKREVRATSAQDAESAPWGLTAGDSAGSWKVQVGTILRGTDSVTAALTCSNPTDAYSLAAGNILAAKITSADPTSYTIVKLTEWPEEDGYTVTFTGTVGAGTFAMTARHYPLWQVVSTQPAGPHRVLGAGLYAVRKVPPCDLVIKRGVYRTPAGEYPTLPSFEPGPGALG